MKFAADFHVHSRFSRATASDLNLSALDWWAGRKGLAVIGVGDATHPQWLAEIEEQLVPAADGLYRLRPDLVRPGGGHALFVISSEISCIYKQGDRTRKVHNLILLPDLAAAHRLSDRLGRLGNVTSDGRPILGLSAKNLLAIALDVSPDSFFIPAHIWTPWFSLFGSKSGFDDIEECFEDLTPQIFAIETGLSSDPPMNWRLSSLDRYVLVSNSDAHSADKLGREACLFETDRSYPAMMAALRGQGGYGGTIEFFPEEGKYHLDGHRDCGRRLEPDETQALAGLCPTCGRPVTVGVMSRVMELADRPAGFKPASAPAFHSLIPLAEVLGQVLAVGPRSKRVIEAYNDLIKALGPELHILRETPTSDLAAAGGPLLGLALERMRAGQVEALGGYDGEFGRISLFKTGELADLAGQARMFALEPIRKEKLAKTKPAKKKAETSGPSDSASITGREAPLLSLDDPLLDDLDPAQREAVTYRPGSLAIVAGPGTGKTLVLTRRAAWLVREGLARPEEILGLTFTRQAAGEMSSRLAASLPFRPGLKKASILTFHALGLKILTDWSGEAPRVLTEEERGLVVKEAAQGSSIKAGELDRLISSAKQKLKRPEDLTDPETAQAYGRYESRLSNLGAVDFDDLVMKAAIHLESAPDLLGAYRRRFPVILIDEYQDINQPQYNLTRLLVAGQDPALTVIGDPDQAIYGFRGADAGYFGRFHQDYPGAKQIRLTRNFRSTETILEASSQVIARNHDGRSHRLSSGLTGPAKVTTADLASPEAEAEYLVSRLERLLGGTSHFALYSGRAGGGREPGGPGLGLADIAVLYRLHALAGPLTAALTRAGLPFQQCGSEPVRETDHLDFQADKISLLTMHAAKGLEFEVVFIIGLEEGLVPYDGFSRSPADPQEERRLFYVAMTRAKRHLFLTRARRRTLYGQRLGSGPSPFLEDIAKELKALDRLPHKKVRPKIVQLDLF